jgi:hypothetical protein
MKEDGEKRASRKSVKKLKKESEEQENPYLSLGFGMNAYFQMLRSFIALFIVITIIAIPILVIYS